MSPPSKRNESGETNCPFWIIHVLRLTGQHPGPERSGRTRRAGVPYHLDMQPHPLPASPSTPSPPRKPPASPPSPTSLDRPFLTGQPDVVMLTFVRHGKQEMPSGSFTPG